ncbi:hypothetical protein FACS1894111_01540 [Clostridia bacterium]|nr:hypothetical protein FACS1894111_01540 [Clostridia bacterium]
MKKTAAVFVFISAIISIVSTFLPRNAPLVETIQYIGGFYGFLEKAVIGIGAVSAIFALITLVTSKIKKLTGVFSLICSLIIGVFAVLLTRMDVVALGVGIGISNIVLIIGVVALFVSSIILLATKQETLLVK